jgi:hypothetical protein
VAAKAYAAVWPRERQPRKEPGLESFALQPVNDVLDRVEFDGLEPVDKGDVAAKLA